MKTRKYYYKTIHELRDLLKTKMNLREKLVNKVSAYDLEIHYLENEILRRGAAS